MERASERQVLHEFMRWGTDQNKDDSGYRFPQKLIGTWVNAFLKREVADGNHSQRLEV